MGTLVCVSTMVKQQRKARDARALGLAFVLLVLSGEALRITNTLKLHRSANEALERTATTEEVIAADAEGHGAALLELGRGNSTHSAKTVTLNDATLTTINAQVKSVKLYLDDFVDSVQHGATAKAKWKAVSKLRNEVHILEEQFGKLLALDNTLPECTAEQLQKAEDDGVNNMDTCIDPELKEKLKGSVQALKQSDISQLLDKFISFVRAPPAIFGLAAVDTTTAAAPVLGNAACAKVINKDSLALENIGNSKNPAKLLGECLTAMSKQKESKASGTKVDEELKMLKMASSSSSLLQVASTEHMESEVDLLVKNFWKMAASAALIGMLIPLFVILGLIFAAAFIVVAAVAPKTAKSLAKPVVQKFMKLTENGLSFDTGIKVRGTRGRNVYVIAK